MCAFVMASAKGFGVYRAREVDMSAIVPREQLVKGRPQSIETPQTPLKQLSYQGMRQPVSVTTLRDAAGHMPNGMPGGQRLPALLELALVDHDSLGALAIRHERLAGELRRAGSSHETPARVLLEKTELDSSIAEVAGAIIESDPIRIQNSADTAFVVSSGTQKFRGR